MFGFSLAELIIVFVVALIFIKPQDLPEIAHFFGKIFYRGKRLFKEIKSSLKEMEKELGVDDLRHEINRGIAEEKAKLEEDMTVIVDIYGNEHRVPNIKDIRPDLTSQEMEEEVKKLNEQNSQKTDISLNQKPVQP
jgi:Sec-independent protein translocase protein TatA